MSVFQQIIEGIFTPVLIVFCLSFLGLLIGKIKIGNICIGLAGVLGISLLLGGVSKGIFLKWDNSYMKSFDFLSSLGSAIFLSVIGLSAGNAFLNKKEKRHEKAFVCGFFVVFLGALIAILIAYMDPTLPKDLLLGLFAGSMTSTPALSAAKELCGEGSAVAVGYGMAYWIGVLSIVLFAQTVRLTTCDISLQKEPFQKATETSADPLLLVFGSGLLGLLFSNVLHISSTVGLLLCGFVIGWALKKQKKKIVNLEPYKNLGLTLFLVGIGFPVGARMTFEIAWFYMFYGLFISLVSVGVGYCMIRYLFHLSKRESLAILCGGMTSTPAIGALQQRDRGVDLSLYSVSYAGATIALQICVRLINLAVL